MIPQYVLVGGMIITLCLTLLIWERWFLEKTKKGRRLVVWFGPQSALWVLRGLLVAAGVFGGLLAAGIVRPIQW